MLFHRARHSARQGLRSPKSPPRPQRVRPQLEELETRNLLSASTATPAVDPSATSTSQTASTTTNTNTTTTTNSAWASQTAQPDVTATPLGATPNAGSGGYVYYTPAQIRQAYGIDQTTLPNGQAATGAGQTIAIVDAYNDPNIANDLATFDAGYGLAAPPSFQVVRMNGVTQSNSGWSYETSLDVEWAHAVAPGANILLVETPSNSYSDLLAGVQYAASQPGVVAVSMSWGGSEFYNETSLDSSFTTPAGHVGGSGLPGGVTFVASSGDSGAWSGAQWPASSPDVLAVGGTSLYLNASNNYSSESAWLYGGGGYSHFEWEPSFQQGVQNSGWRTSPDVSYDANPYTGFVVYNSLDLPSGASGWWLEGGTSAGAPQWAGIMALADQARAANGLGSLGNGQQEVYSLPSSDFHQITSGTNGYQATSGYNMATGLGSPIVNRIVADLAGLAGANSTTQTGLYSGTTGSTTRPLDTTAGLPIAGTQTGAGGGSTASADPAAETLLPASSLTPGQETLPASIVESPSPAGMMLTPAANQAPPGVIECPSAPPSNPATDAVFINLGATGWLPAAVSDEVTPELTASLLQGQAGEAPLLDAAAADGGEAANA